MHYQARPGARELKFLLTPELASSIQEWARLNLQPDPHAGGSHLDSYRVTSLYYDTPQFDVFHQRGSYGRAKYRARRYDRADSVFVERKLKTRDYVTKRRSLVSLTDLAQLGSGRAEWGSAGFWFERRLAARRLQPVCAISYLRTARVAESGSGLIRLTIDEDLRALPAVTGQSALDEVATGFDIAPGRRILEMKYRGALPGLFKDLLDRFLLERASISKYRTAACALGLANLHE